MVTSWRNYWKHKGHVYGQCYTRPDSGYYFVNIPKNSSSWTQTLVAHWCLWEPFNYYDTPEILDKTALIVLRDPVERWISGIGEYISLYHPDFDPDNVNDTMLEWIFDRVSFDDHTERQVMFIENIDPNKTIWFWADADFSSNFSSFMLEIGELNDTFKMEPPANTSAGNLRKQRNTSFFKNQLKNEKYLHKITHYFRDDFQLIQSVKFFKK